MLREEGYRAYALEGGLAAWQGAGYPTEPRELEQARDLDDLCAACGCPAEEHRAAARRA